MLWLAMLMVAEVVGPCHAILKGPQSTLDISVSDGITDVAARGPGLTPVGQGIRVVTLTLLDADRTAGASFKSLANKVGPDKVLLQFNGSDVVSAMSAASSVSVDWGGQSLEIIPIGDSRELLARISACSSGAPVLTSGK